MFCEGEWEEQSQQPKHGIIDHYGVIGRADPRLLIPVFRNLFFGPKKTFLTGFLRIIFSCVFLRNFSQERGFGGGRRNSCFFFILKEFFAGIPAGQEFLYLLRIPQESGGFWRIPVPTKSCWLWPATKEGSLLSTIWTKMTLFNLSPEQDLTMVSLPCPLLVPPGLKVRAAEEAETVLAWQSRLR